MAKTKVTRIQFNYAGFNAVRRSPQVAADIERRAQAIAAAAGEGMEVRTGLNASRAWATVSTGTDDAKRAEAEDKALTRAIDSGRG